MKIYFSGSIRGGWEHQEIYHSIIGLLKKQGEVLTEFVGDSTLTYKGSSLPTSEIYKRDVGLIDMSDIVVAEVSTPSLGVGYEIAYAESKGIPIICLYKPEEGKSLSGMIEGNPNVRLFRYNNVSEAEEIINKNVNLA
ncbi:MAG: nucleoside 2-deoxyribosyltransferase [Minisyncoccia bacterium]